MTGIFHSDGVCVPCDHRKWSAKKGQSLERNIGTLVGKAHTEQRSVRCLLVLGGSRTVRYRIIYSLASLEAVRRASKFE